jgi:hypothetical protein
MMPVSSSEELVIGGAGSVFVAVPTAIATGLTHGARLRCWGSGLNGRGGYPRW